MAEDLQEQIQIEPEQSNEKKIISSKVYHGKNGRFRILCVAINDRQDYDYLKNLIMSKKEIEDGLLGVTVVRVTDDQSSDGTMCEFSEEKNSFESQAERLMFVLRKFKVENVIVSVCFYEYDMLKATMDNNFDVVTKRLKEFVLELYSSMFEVSGMMSNNVPFAKSNEIKTNQLDFETMKHFDLMLPVDSRKKQKEKERKKLSKMTLALPEPKKEKVERPNYVYAGKFKAPEATPEKSPLHIQKSVLENSLQVKAQEIEKYSSMLADKDIVEVKQLVKYESFDIVKKIFLIVMIINDADPDAMMMKWVYEFDLEGFVKHSTVNVLSPIKMKKISDILNTNAGFNYQSVRTFNKKLGVFFQFIIALIRCYDYNLRYALVMNEIESQENDKLMTKADLTQNLKDILRENPGKARQWEFNFDNIPLVPEKSFMPQFMIDHKLKYQKELQKKNREMQFEGGGFFVTNIPYAPDLDGHEKLNIKVSKRSAKDITLTMPNKEKSSNHIIRQYDSGNLPKLRNR